MSSCGGADRPGDVAVWVVALDLAAEAPEDGLDAGERARAAAFRFATDRRRFVASHRALREVLGGRLGLPPAAVAIGADAHGKPAAAGVAFSLAHAGPWALVAVADAGPAGADAAVDAGALGVDVEPLRALDDAEGLARAALTPGELAVWATLATADRDAALLRAWTRKEAVLKARGLGLAIDPREVGVGVGPAGGREVRSGDRRWAVVDLAVAPGVAAALACPAPAPVIRVRPWPAPGVHRPLI